MQPHLIFSIFMFIYQKKKTTAKTIADVFEVSTRSVYRYINALSCAQIPIYTKNGKNGGIFIDEKFKISDVYFTLAEKELLKELLKSIKNDYPNEFISKLIEKI